MPYVKQELRDTLGWINPLPANGGELNYAITNLCHEYIKAKGLSYAIANEVVGALECSKLELYRTVVSSYEDVKRAENGSVSELDKAVTVVAPVAYSEKVVHKSTGPTGSEIADEVVRRLTAAIAQQPAPPTTEPTLKPGQAQVLQGPIPGDVGGKEVKSAPVKPPRAERKNTKHQPAAKGSAQSVWEAAANGDDLDL